mmetsp:Transcript_104938/g.306499  ORF Transcript_104938/g.306499 Transcript_104938/m.306499 type:complete len:272 (+) Transcript_104938:643-1458(+)
MVLNAQEPTPKAASSRTLPRSCPVLGRAAELLQAATAAAAGHGLLAAAREEFLAGACPPLEQALEPPHSAAASVLRREALHAGFNRALRGVAGPAREHAPEIRQSGAASTERRPVLDADFILAPSMITSARPSTSAVSSSCHSRALAKSEVPRAPVVVALLNDELCAVETGVARAMDRTCRLGGWGVSRLEEAALASKRVTYGAQWPASGILAISLGSGMVFAAWKRGEASWGPSIAAATTALHPPVIEGRPLRSGTPSRRGEGKTTTGGW